MDVEKAQKAIEHTLMAYESELEFYGELNPVEKEIPYKNCTYIIHKSSDTPNMYCYEALSEDISEYEGTSVMSADIYTSFADAVAGAKLEIDEGLIS